MQPKVRILTFMLIHLLWAEAQLQVVSHWPAAADQMVNVAPAVSDPLVSPVVLDDAGAFPVAVASPPIEVALPAPDEAHICRSFLRQLAGVEVGRSVARFNSSVIIKTLRCNFLKDLQRIDCCL